MIYGYTRRISILVLVAVLLSACQIGIPNPQATATTLNFTSTIQPLSSTASPSTTSTETPTLTEQPPTATNIASTATHVAPTATLPPTATSGPIVNGPNNFPSGVNPLTGLKVTDAKLLDRRPMAIKIQLFPRGQRPAWGISLADLVFDYYQNNGLTRLTAVFYGNDAKQVGPIRSARIFDASIIRMYKTVFAFGGADQRILTRFFSAEFYDRLILEGNQNCPPMCRIDPNGYNYLVTNTTELSKYVTDKKISNTRQNLDGMSFNSLTPSGGQPGKQALLHFSISAYVRWDYNAASGRYLRFQDNVESSSPQDEVFTPFLDRLTDQQVAADNVVVLLLLHEGINQSGGNEIVDIQLSGSGPAYAYRDGQVYKVNWNRPSNDAALFLTFPDGKPYPFKPGNTWFEVIGQYSKVEQKDAGILRFVFGIP